MDVVKPLEQRGNHETSRRVLQIINQVFRYAVITGRAKHNVAADLRGALRLRKTVHRAAVLEPEKVGQLLRDIDNYEGYFPLVCALKLTPLVFTRPTELRAAQWQEFDLEARGMAHPCRTHEDATATSCAAVRTGAVHSPGTSEILRRGAIAFPLHSHRNPSPVGYDHAQRPPAHGLPETRNERARLPFHCLHPAQ